VVVLDQVVVVQLVVPVAQVHSYSKVAAVAIVADQAVQVLVVVAEKPAIFYP
jgi:hypothetical protein